MAEQAMDALYSGVVSYAEHHAKFPSVGYAKYLESVAKMMTAQAAMIAAKAQANPPAERQLDMGNITFE